MKHASVQLSVFFKDYLREQPDNVKSFNIIGEVTRFLNVVYSNINGKNIDLVIQLFETMNEFTAVGLFGHLHIVSQKSFIYLNFQDFINPPTYNKHILTCIFIESVE